MSRRVIYNDIVRMYIIKVLCNREREILSKKEFSLLIYIILIKNSILMDLFPIILPCWRKSHTEYALRSISECKDDIKLNK